MALNDMLWTSGIVFGFRPEGPFLSAQAEGLGRNPPEGSSLKGSFTWMNANERPLQGRNIFVVFSQAFGLG